MRVPFYSVYSSALAIEKQSREVAVRELIDDVSALYPGLLQIPSHDLLGRTLTMRSSATEDELGFRIERGHVEYLVLNVWESKSIATQERLVALSDLQQSAVEKIVRTSRYVAQIPTQSLSRDARLETSIVGRRPYVYLFLKAEGLAQAGSDTSDRAKREIESLISQFRRIEEALAGDEVFQLRLQEEESFLKECDRQLHAAAPAIGR